jgi:pantothenate kinase
MVSFTLNLAGQHWDVTVPGKELETVHLPLLKDIVRKAAAKAGRYIVFIAGPPGSGKTTLGVLWETLAREHDFPVAVQTLPMDGFHFPNAKLNGRTILRDGKSISLRKIKGAPESFDRKAITRAFHDLCSEREFTWPKYDRQIHDPVPDAIPVLAEGIIMVEGNYLLLDEPGWRAFKPIADLTIFIECDETLVRQRLLARLQRGGRSYKNAIQHYEFNDYPNWKRVMQHRLKSDVVLRFEDGGCLVRLDRSGRLIA